MVPAPATITRQARADLGQARAPPLPTMLPGSITRPLQRRAATITRPHLGGELLDRLRYMFTLTVHIQPTIEHFECLYVAALAGVVD